MFVTTRRAEEALEEGEQRSQLVEYMKRWNELPSFTVVLIRMQDVHKREMIETQVRERGRNKRLGLWALRLTDADHRFPDQPTNQPD